MHNKSRGTIKPVLTTKLSRLTQRQFYYKLRVYTRHGKYQLDPKQSLENEACPGVELHARSSPLQG